MRAVESDEDIRADVAWRNAMATDTKGAERMVLAMLANLEAKEPGTPQDVETVAIYARVTPRRAHKALKALEARGLVKYVGPPNKSRHPNAEYLPTLTTEGAKCPTCGALLHGEAS